MNVLNELERRFQKFAIPHFFTMLLVGQIAVLVMWGSGTAPEEFILVGSLVMEGELFRTIAFMLMPITASPLWFIIFFMFYMSIGNSLEAQWGTFRFQTYIVTSWILCVIASLIFPSEMITNQTIFTSVFLAFACLFPNHKILLFFVIPVAVKWLGLIAGGFIVLQLVSGYNTVEICTSLFTFVLFFTPSLVGVLKASARRQKFQAAAAVSALEAFHTCSVCGKTDKTHPNVSFRYQNGTCYCQSYLERGNCDEEA